MSRLESIDRALQCFEIKVDRVGLKLTHRGSIDNHNSVDFGVYPAHDLTLSIYTVRLFVSWNLVVYIARRVKFPGLTAFGTQRIRKGTVLSAFRLLVDENFMRLIQRYTETAARVRMGDESWSLSLDKLVLDDFIGIMYACGLYGASKFDLKRLWVPAMGLEFLRWKNV